MLMCLNCDRPLTEGAFLPEPDAEFVCLHCYERRAGRPSDKKKRLTAGEMRNFARQRQYNEDADNATGNSQFYVRYVDRASQRGKLISKRNIITFRQLPPGS